jgi:hypothetical protein
MAAKKQQVSLFPFLDILACVIGNLILIIVAVVLEQTDTQPVAEAAKIEEMKEEVEQNQLEKQRLEKRLAEIQEKLGTNDAQLVAARERLREAEKKLDEAEKRRREAPKEVPQLDPKLAELVKQLSDEKRKLEAELVTIRAEILESGKVPDQAIQVLPPARVDVGADAPLRSLFIEVTKEGLVVNDEGKSWKVDRAAIAGNGDLQKRLREIAADKDASVTFLVRPDALDVLPQAEQAALAARAVFGKVPLPGEGVLDLSQLKGE